MRCYTQNIDGLEAREALSLDLKQGQGNKRRFMKKHYGVPRPQHTAGTDFDGGCEVVQLHGDLETLRCSVCASHWTWTENETEIYMAGCAPQCQKCAAKSNQRQATGKRGLSVGSLRPNIVLYGEDHPSNTILTPFVPFDAASQPEVLIVMGTSLKVFGLQKIVREFAKAVHDHKNGKGKVIFVNRTKPAESIWDNYIDYHVSMECDDWVEDLRNRRPDLWLRQGEIDLKVTKTVTGKRKRKTEIFADESATQPKKTKISVEIPAPSRKLAKLPKTMPATKLAPGATKAPMTPRHPKAGADLRQMISPLVRAKRPQPSPFKELKPIVVDYERGILLPGSPRTPAKSPLTPRVQLLNGAKKPDFEQSEEELEIAESDHEKENLIPNALPEDLSSGNLDDESKGSRSLLQSLLQSTVEPLRKRYLGEADLKEISPGIGSFSSKGTPNRGQR